MEKFQNVTYRRQPIMVIGNEIPVFISNEEALLLDVDGSTNENPFWNSHSELIARMNRNRIECTIQLLLDTKSIAPRILDLACGQGIVTSEIRKHFPAAVLNALDISQKAIEIAKGGSTGIEFCVGNAFDMPYNDAVFDIVVCNNFWEHVGNPVVLVHEVSRVLKEDGVFIFSTPNRYRFLNLWSLLRGRKVTLLNEKLHVTEYSIGQIEEILRFGGMRLQRVISKEVARTDLTMKTKIVVLTIKKFISVYMKAVKSHHRLEETIFVTSCKVSIPAI